LAEPKFPVPVVIKVSAVPTAEDGVTEIVQVEGVLPIVTGLVHETAVVVGVGTAKAGFRLAVDDNTKQNDARANRKMSLLILIIETSLDIGRFSLKG
jgi:hypothetical protein